MFHPIFSCFFQGPKVAITVGSGGFKQGKTVGRMAVCHLAKFMACVNLWGKGCFYLNHLFMTLLVGQGRYS